MKLTLRRVVPPRVFVFLILIHFIAFIHRVAFNIQVLSICVFQIQAF